MNPSIKPNTAFSQDVRVLAKTPDNKESGPMGQQVSEVAHDRKIGDVNESIYATNKKQLNAAIIESSLKFSTTAGEQPLSLLLKTALQGINEALKEAGVESNVEDTFESGIDFSPEATAERIVSFSTQLLGSYREQHPEMEEEELLTSFTEIIGGGIDQGFSEAKDILGGLKVLEGDIADSIDKTYALVQAGLKSFVDAFNKAEEE